MQTLQLADYQIVIGDFWKNFHGFLAENNYSKIFILFDENTEEHCFIRYIEAFPMEKTHTMRIQSGELNKNLETCQIVWQKMFDGKSVDEVPITSVTNGVHTLTWIFGF